MKGFATLKFLWKLTIIKGGVGAQKKNLENMKKEYMISAILPAVFIKGSKFMAK